MPCKLAVNGFGRIGRLVARCAANSPALELVGINDLTDARTLAHLFKYDSVHGIFPGEVGHTDGEIVINGRPARVTASKNPAELPWRELGVDIVIESTGIFRSLDKARAHLDAGAKKVIISAPAKGSDVATFVYGINHEQYDPARDHVISNASCTTNCVVPVAKVLHDSFRILKAYMTTIHAYTGDQRILDFPHSDLRRARAAALSMIPTTTGAAKLIGVIFPELAGKVDGMAIRVPTPDVSIVDFSCTVEKSTDANAVNAAFKDAANGPLKGILQYCADPLVSVDMVGNRHSSILDAGLTAVVDGNLIKAFSWYDNEYGYACRLVDMARFLAERL
ncbi:MAG TPA: type I glyceraldehyde-3-phosphate dehydrogenase [candidate division WOR-3 bacterium]|uniref:Type I glyceraldehyde-3-phosphate dehydrogenase n=1 Tax=candidate division WOR-3 bacterium TaxID=2052148 RepID=A0A7V0T773_UNCW3|nr:type I glyceraldehyde-3-phosphate dehydrogenase [candidate division WOR-3 bacterium]